MEQALPTWVIVEGGRREPFEADRISQSLFAVTETLGQPNAFLARELADGVLHFLAMEGLGETVRAEQITEIAAKVVRELGHPALSRILEKRRRVLPEPVLPTKASGFAVQFNHDQSPEDAVRSCLEQYSLHVVYARDLASAHEEGLLTLENLDAPRAFAAMQLDARSLADEAWRFLDPARGQASIVVLEGLEWAWIGASEPETAAWLHRLECALRANRGRLDVHLHVSQPPLWARASTGPLFAGEEGGAPLDSQAVLGRLEQGIEGPLHVTWHVASQEPVKQETLRTLQSICNRKGWQASLAFDRPKQPVSLSHGLDRQHPAALGSVRLNLCKLLERPGLGEESQAYIGKLASLSRMAVSAGVQKRNYLRRAATELSRGFAVERARWLIAVCGIDAVVRHFLKQGLAESRVSRALGRVILDTMRQTLQEESRRTGLNMALAPELPADAADLCHPEDVVRVESADSGQIEWLRERTPVASCCVISGTDA